MFCKLLLLLQIVNVIKYPLPFGAILKQLSSIINIIIPDLLTSDMGHNLFK
jgi:hypothetical protein